MKKAIVTGANGFIGKWLVKELVEHHVMVYAIVHTPSKCFSNIPSDMLHVISCDMEHIDELKEKIQEKDLDVFFHLAWAGSTGSARSDYSLQLQNVKWTCDAVRVASQLGIHKFVGAGTLAEIDCNSYIPEDGSTPNGVSCYGSAKIAAHYMSKAIASQLKIEHVWAYLSNTYGEGNQTQNFVNFASKLMLSGQKAAFTSGEQPYDFVYVSDSAQGLRCIGESGKNMCSYYIGSGKAKQLKEYIYMIRDAIDPKIKLYLGEIPFHGNMLPDTVFSCEKLCKDTGYSPRVPFEEGIRETIEWLRKGEKA